MKINPKVPNTSIIQLANSAHPDELFNLDLQCLPFCFRIIDMIMFEQTFYEILQMEILSSVFLVL